MGVAAAVGDERGQELLEEDVQLPQLAVGGQLRTTEFHAGCRHRFLEVAIERESEREREVGL